MFLDTSGLLCLLNQLEPKHQQARELFASARTYLVHDHILTELVALAHSRSFARKPTLELIEFLLATPKVTTMFVDRDLLLQAISLLEARPDTTYSLCDAVSFVLMRQQDETDALTSDKHFEQEGFRRLL